MLQGTGPIAFGAIDPDTTERMAEAIIKGADRGEAEEGAALPRMRSFGGMKRMIKNIVAHR